MVTGLMEEIRMLKLGFEISIFWTSGCFKIPEFVTYGDAWRGLCDFLTLQEHSKSFETLLLRRGVA